MIRCTWYDHPIRLLHYLQKMDCMDQKMGIYVKAAEAHFSIVEQLKNAGSAEGLKRWQQTPQTNMTSTKWYKGLQWCLFPCKLEVSCFTIFCGLFQITINWNNAVPLNNHLKLSALSCKVIRHQSQWAQMKYKYQWVFYCFFSFCLFMSFFTNWKKMPLCN